MAVAGRVKIDAKCVAGLSQRNDGLVHRTSGNRRFAFRGKCQANYLHGGKVEAPQPVDRVEATHSQRGR